MICCDICWIVLGKSHEYEDMLDKSIFWIGQWSVCKECLKRHEDNAFKEIKSKEFKKN